MAAAPPEFGRIGERGVRRSSTPRRRRTAAMPWLPQRPSRARMGPCSRARIGRGASLRR